MQSDVEVHDLSDGASWANTVLVMPPGLVASALADRERNSSPFLCQCDETQIFLTSQIQFYATGADGGQAIVDTALGSAPLARSAAANPSQAAIAQSTNRWSS